jgi:hypothetical protein
VSEEEMRADGRGGRKWPVAAFLVVLGLLLVAQLISVASSGATNSLLVRFLVKPGDMKGFRPGKPQVFPSIPELTNPSGEHPSSGEIERYETEGLVEAATVRIHGRAESVAKGDSWVFRFIGTSGPMEEMKAELKKDLEPKALRTEVKPYFSVRHLRVPGVASAAAFAFISNKASDALGVESGIAKGLVVEGNCLLELDLYRPLSKEVIRPIISAVQAVSRRAVATCP